MSVKTYESADDFYEEADWPEYIVRDHVGDVWLAWETEEGEWYAVRPMNEDDPQVDGDTWRPVGPVHLGLLRAPLTVVPTDVALRPQPTGLGHDFQPVAGHPDDDECTYQADGSDATYCGEPLPAHEVSTSSEVEE